MPLIEFGSPLSGVNTPQLTQVIAELSMLVDDETKRMERKWHDEHHNGPLAMRLDLVVHALGILKVASLGNRQIMKQTLEALGRRGPKVKGHKP